MQKQDAIEVRDMRAGNWLWVNREILYSPKINATDYKVYSGLASWANYKSQKAPAGLVTLAKKLHLGKNTVIRSLKRLETIGLILVKREDGQRNIYSLLNIDKEKIKEEVEIKIEIPKNKKINVEEEKKERRDYFVKWFLDQIIIKSIQEKEEMNLFVDYWTETNRNGIKMFWQKKSTFDIKRRWQTWMRNKQNNFGRGKPLPSDQEIRKETKININAQQRKIKNEINKERTHEEQASINKTLTIMRENLVNKVSIN